MKKTALVVLILVIIGGGIAALVMMGDDDDTTSSSDTSQTSDDTSAPTSDAETEGSLSAADEAHLGDANRGQVVDATGQTEVTVTLTDSMINPTVLTIKSGTTVKWVNEGNDDHNVATVSSSPKSFADSPMLDTGEEYSVTFDEVGSYYYICSVHPSDMRAIIKVVE